MLKFLRQTRKIVNTADAICIVIGNESCDLDSAVSALTLAYFYNERRARPVEDNCQPGSGVHYLPVLNIPRRDYSLKTEVVYAFEQHAILEDSLTFHDDLDKNFIERSDIILVDHHVSPYSAQCIEVFDHRPLDAGSNLPPNCKKQMELVGSCATLIGERLLQGIVENAELPKYSCPLDLLRSAIILDTINFSPDARRATPKDKQICDALEKILSPDPGCQPRTTHFEMLCKARADVSKLTPLQLLHKDMKIIRNANESIGIALPGFPMLVRQFISKLNAEEAVQQLLQSTNCSVVLLIGMFVCEGGKGVERDVGLIGFGEDGLGEAINKAMLQHMEPNFNFSRYESCKFMDGRFYKQNNTTATRKHIVPLVKAVLESWSSQKQQTN